MDKDTRAGQTEPAPPKRPTDRLLVVAGRLASELWGGRWHFRAEEDDRQA